MVVDAWGARRAMALGGTSNAINLTMYWMIATEKLKLHDLDLLILVLSALGVLIFVGCALVTGSVFKVIVESCGEGTKGKAVGWAKGYVGVGSGVYVCLFGPAMLSFIKRIGSSNDGGLASSISLADAPPDPEMTSLNFLLMAATLSFLAATLPALLFLPKQASQSEDNASTSSSSPYRDRRDGTRSIHFRVVYAGLMMLGMWVVGVSLLELEEEHTENTNSTHHESATGLDPSILNNTLLLDGDSLLDHHDAFSDHQDQSASFVRILMNATRRLSSSSPERHWGRVFFLLLLWWGPALSLLVIPPRKECAEESVHSISDNDNQQSFTYEEEEDDGVNGTTKDSDEGEEETFLQDELPTNGNRRSSETKVTAERNFTLTQMLRTCPAWLMAWTSLILVGGGTVMTNNIGE